MLIENNNFAHIVIEYVVICILQKLIQENTEKRVPNISNKSCIRSEGIGLTFAKYSCIQQDIPLSFLFDKKRRSTNKESWIEK